MKCWLTKKSEEILHKASEDRNLTNLRFAEFIFAQPKHWNHRHHRLMMRRNPNFHCYALFSRRETKAVVEAARSNSMRWRLARAQMIVMTNELNTFFFPFFKFFFGMESCSALSQFLHLFLFSGRTRVWCLRLIRKKNLDYKYPSTRAGVKMLTKNSNAEQGITIFDLR